MYSISYGTVAASPEQQRLQDEKQVRCVHEDAIADELLEAKAQGVEWAKDHGGMHCIRCDSRIAELRAQKGQFA